MTLSRLSPEWRVGRSSLRSPLKPPQGRRNHHTGDFTWCTSRARKRERRRNYGLERGGGGGGMAPTFHPESNARLEVSWRRTLCLRLFLRVGEHLHRRGCEPSAQRGASPRTPSILRKWRSAEQRAGPPRLCGRKPAVLGLPCARAALHQLPSCGRAEDNLYPLEMETLVQGAAPPFCRSEPLPSAEF